MPLGQLYIPVAAAYAAALFLLLQRRDRPASWALWLAIVLHAAFLAARSQRLGFFNSGAILEGQVFLPFCLAAIALGLRQRGRTKEWLPVALAAAALALLSLPIAKGVIPPSPKSGSALVPLFFACEIAAHALFITAAVLAFPRRRAEGSLPLAHRFCVWGFVIYSVAQVSGAAWCYQGWSVPFQWGFRHLHSAAIWCVYANYIHLRFIPWWSDRRKGYYLAGGAALLLAYLAVLQFIEAGQARIGG